MVKDIRERLEERFPDTEFLLADGLDEAVIGIDSKTMRVIYSKEKIIEILMERDEMERTEALEYFSFNIQGAYVGDKTPIYMEQIPE